MLFLFLLPYLICISSAKIPLIIDTDMDYDVDDVGAVCIAHALADMGEVDLIAMVHNVGYPRAIGAVSVLNHFYGRDDVPLGAFKGKFGADAPGIYIDDLVENFPSPVKDYSEVEDAVTVLRRALSGSEDGTVVISSVGFLTNLADLLVSPEDDISSMTGWELVERKVRMVAVMGGVYPQTTGWSEFNFNCGMELMGDALDCGGKAREAVLGMPESVKMVFSGFEVGIQVNTGAVLTKCARRDNPCRRAYVDYVGQGENRYSWDPLTLLFAVRGAEAVGCVEVGQRGNNVVSEDGFNWWEEGDESNQTYLVMEEPDVAGKAIDELLCAAPTGI